MNFQFMVMLGSISQKTGCMTGYVEIYWKFPENGGGYTSGEYIHV